MSGATSSATTAPAAPGASFWARRGMLIAWLAALVVSLPALAVQPFGDDFTQHLVLERTAVDLPIGPATLYDFTSGPTLTPLLEQGYVPWQAHPELSLRFFRPLSSLSIALDHLLFGRASFPAHLINLAWFFGLLALAMRLFGRCLPAASAGLSAVVYGVAGVHATNVAWVSTRHLLIGGVFGTLAVWLHVCHREPGIGRGRRAPVWSAPLALIAGLFSSESVLTAVAFIASYEAFGSRDALRRRVAACSPSLLIAGAYLIHYALAGYGARHSGLYVSPFSQPLAFAEAVVSRWPVLVGEMTSSLPAGLWGREPAAQPLLVGGLLVSAGFLALCLKCGNLTPESKRHLGWLTVGGLAGTLPMVSGPPDGRLLVLPALGFAPLVATAILTGWQVASSTPWRRLVRLSAGVLAVLHLGLSPALRVGLTVAMAMLGRGQRALALEADLSACRPGARAFVLTGADPSLSLYGATSLSYFRPELRSRIQRLYVLSMAPHDQRLTRQSERGYLLEVEQLPRRFTVFEKLFRDTPIEPGTEVQIPNLSVRVLATDAGLPTRFEFEVPNNHCFVRLEDRQLTALPPPPIGSSLAVVHEPGPFGL